LKGKWRNSLSQAERSGLTLLRDPVGATAHSFLTGYGTDKSAKDYRGPKPRRLGSMIAAAASSGDLLILNAKRERKTVAAMLILRHGCTATYQAGWTSNEGRTSRAHHLLLWTAIEALKAQGVERLDLGGVHPKMAEGVTRFKKGLGGTVITLPGLFG
jgi:lipid II:glycine glycyltransferase (peptidoglycan interpeptide bridge formation enzyme)